MNVTTGATLSGGATTVLSPAGFSPGKSVFTAPGHSHLTPRTVTFTSQPPVSSKTGLGVARSGMKISRADRSVSEECCTVKEGDVIVDLGFRWNLNQSESEADDIIALLQGLVFNAAFISHLKAGLVPSA